MRALVAVQHRATTRAAISMVRNLRRRLRDHNRSPREDEMKNADAAEAAPIVRTPLIRVQ
jgi:hypothetical protein